MLKKAKIEYLEALRDERNKYIEELKALPHEGPAFEKAERLLKEYFFRPELDSFKGKINDQLKEHLVELGWEDIEEELNEIIGETLKWKRYEAQDILERSHLLLKRFVAEYPSKIPDILRLLLELDYLENRIVTLKKEIGLIK